MKQRVLLTGRYQMIYEDFFTHLTDNFESVSSSLNYTDITNHIKFFNPNLFVYCVSGETSDDMTMIAKMKAKFIRDNISLIIIGDPYDVSQFNDHYPSCADLLIQRPITTSGINQKILDFLTQLEKERAEEEAEAKAASEAKSAGVATEEVNIQDVDDSLIMKQPEGIRKHILVVDDDSRMLKLIKSYLIDYYDVATAINGNVALKFLENRKTDLILLDYEMPGENGPAVLERLRANNSTANIPVIFLTGVSDKERIQEVLSMRPQGYILKPVSRAKLFETLSKVIR